MQPGEYGGRQGPIPASGNSSKRGAILVERNNALRVATLLVGSVRGAPERAAKVLPVERHALHNGEDRHSWGNPELLGRIAREPGNQRLAVAVDTHLDARALA